MDKINHFSLTHWGSVHNEEALTALELQARGTAKINECVEVINRQIEIINKELAKLEGYAVEAVDESIKDGRIAEQLNDFIWSNLQVTLEDLLNRLDNLVLNATPAGADNAEIVDARTNGITTYNSLGQHVRNLGNGSAWRDAVRPGTVRAGRIMAGMTGGDLRDKYTIRETIPMAGHWVGQAGYYDINTMDFVAHDGYKMSDLIPCEYGDTFILESYLFGPLVKPAVVFDASKNPITILGTPGNSTWDMFRDEVHITLGNAAYIAFVCGSGYLSAFRAQRVGMKEATDRDIYGNGKGYIHARAKKRTDTITDRAQVKVWFKLPADHTAERIYHIPVQLMKYTNLGSWTIRLFAAASGSTYETQLPTSASGYNFTTYGGLRPYFTVPLETSEGVPVTHVCLFIDLLPARPDEFINAYLCPLSMSWDGGSVEGDGYLLHGHLDTDTLNLVWPGAASSPLYGKRILGVGDSLMAGNTLRKEKTWFNLLAGARDMAHYNAAVNGRPVGGSDGMAVHLPAMLEAFPNPDYAIIQGGANDLRLGISVESFRSALRSMVSIILEHNPKCKILFATNWHRSDYINPAGHDEDDYVTAMLEEAENLRIPVVNNYATGILLTDPHIAAWADQGIVSGGEANIHFSEAANEYIVPTYIKALEGI